MKEIKIRRAEGKDAYEITKLRHRSWLSAYAKEPMATKDVARLKIGIGPQPNVPSEVFVLQNFAKEELETLKPVLSKSKEGIECFFKEGIAVAQNKYN